LLDRDIKIAAPADEDHLSHLKESISSEMFRILYENIYKDFDGFMDGDFDSASFLRIWSIREIVTSSFNDGNFVPFVDFSFNSEIYGLVRGRGSIIYAKFSKRATSVSVENLIRKLIDGKFDYELGLY
jgi:hypothetical protein